MSDPTPPRLDREQARAWYMFLSHHLNNAITPVIGFATKLPGDHPLRGAITAAARRIEAVLSVTRAAGGEP